MLNPAKLAERSPPIPLRVPLLLAAAVLAVLSLWLLATELMRPGIEQLPTDPANAIAAAQTPSARSEKSISRNHQARVVSMGNHWEPRTVVSGLSLSPGRLLTCAARIGSFKHFA